MLRIWERATKTTDALGTLAVKILTLGIRPRKSDIVIAVKKFDTSTNCLTHFILENLNNRHSLVEQ